MTKYKNIMAGCCLTHDGGMIISLTIDANGEIESDLLVDLKTFLKSNYGLINYSQYPEFDNIEQFKKLCEIRERDLNEFNKNNDSQNFVNTDAICCVLANIRSYNLLIEALNRFLPNKETLPTDYAHIDNQNEKIFISEKEMLEYFINHLDVEQTFFWNNI